MQPLPYSRTITRSISSGPSEPVRMSNSTPPSLKSFNFSTKPIYSEPSSRKNVALSRSETLRKNLLGKWQSALPSGAKKASNQCASPGLKDSSMSNCITLDLFLYTTQHTGTHAISQNSGTEYNDAWPWTSHRRQGSLCLHVRHISSSRSYAVLPIQPTGYWRRGNRNSTHGHREPSNNLGSIYLKRQKARTQRVQDIVIHHSARSNNSTTPEVSRAHNKL